MINKIIYFIISFFLGVIISLMGGFLQASKSTYLINFPWGIVVYFIILIFSVNFVRKSFRSRLTVLSFSIGWLIITLLMSTRSPAGDLVLTNNYLAITYLITSVIFLATFCTMPIRIK